MMKRIILFFCLLTSSLLLAQTEGFNYKALLTDNGNALSNHAVNIRFTILQDGTTNVYEETHTTTTDANGIVGAIIGEGTSTDDFNAIDWGAHPYSLKVEINTGTGYTDFGTSALKKVPFAKYADKAGNTFSGDFNDLTNVPTGLANGDDDTHLSDAEIAAMGYIKNPNDADHDATNELQTISKTGNTVTLSNGGGSFTDANTHLTETQVDNYVANNGYLTSEIDGSTTNELQTISKSGNTVTLSNGGGSFTDADSHLSDAQIATMGYIKNPDDADSDDTNELQNLSLSGNQLNISDGNNVTFTGWDTNAGDDVQALNDLSDAKTNIQGVFVGHNSGTNVNSSSDLVGLGISVMPDATSADYSVGIGNYALNHLYSGVYNTAIGHRAGYSLNTGSNNTFVGEFAGFYATNASGNVFIGSNAGYNETGSNKLYIANSSTATPLIYGDFNTNELTVNGSLAIKDGTQGAGKVLVSDANGKGSWSNNLPAQNKYLDISQYEAVSVYQSDHLYQSYYGATIWDTNSTSNLYFSIRLPEGIVLQNLVVYYRDDSSNDLVIGVKRRPLYATSNTMITHITTSGNNTNLHAHTFTLNETTIPGYVYYVIVYPKSGDHWDSNMAIKGIRVEYTE